MPRFVWTDSNYVAAYELAREGLSDQKIAEGLGVSPQTLITWKRRKKAFREAIERGRERVGGKGTGSFFEYIYERLPPELKDLWDEINAADKSPNGVQRIEALLQANGKRARQQLFFHALVSSNFNPSEACRKVNIARSTFDRWMNEDPGFPELMDEIEWHKKNFFEGALVDLVKRRNVLATIFVNKTKNKDRGYSEKLDVNLSGDVNHHHSFLDINTLDLDLETREKLLKAIEEKEKQNATN